MKDIMLDLETLGTEPGCALLSIGAVVFDPKGDGCGEEFYVNVDPKDCFKYGLRSDPDTVAWWKKQSDEAKQGLVNDRQPLKEALVAFREWYMRVDGLKVWCQGASFDAPILAKAYHAIGSTEPYKFWNIRDTRTVYDVCEFNSNSVPREGTYHNALDDSKHQVRCVQEALKSFNKV